MDWETTSLHPEFRLNGIKCSIDDLQEIGYNLIKEGEEFEQQIGDFLIDWSSDDDFIMVNTSGSTGPPKRIHLKKSTMAHSARATGEFLKLDKGSKALLCLSASNIAGKMILVRAMLLGWHLDYVAPSRTPLSSIEKYYDFCSMVPMQVSASLGKLDSVRTLLIGGAPVSADLKSSMNKLKTKVFESYGMTETASHIALRPLSESACKLVNGKTEVFVTMKGVKVSIDDRACLVIHAQYISDKSIITNDLVEVVGPDQFRWLGRLDHVINSGGIKLMPEQIESRLDQSIEARFILTALPDTELGERLVMVIEGPDKEGINLEKLKQIEGLQSYEIPKEIFFLEKFPETETGKIKRKDINQMIQGNL